MIDRVSCDDTTGCDGRGCNITNFVYVCVYEEGGVSLECVSGV